ncbi:CLUMA_CG010473, isoform A [Clunio marinus]|uniref:CLUMA_CG010473, isoform A n=1 Tax=Clunio marinus TaxID=568069 RepID=A0A1J1IBE5_9DIPT|nr:CLUMA_CG010473, isoform A [Clunio marinus]
MRSLNYPFSDRKLIGSEKGYSDVVLVMQRKMLFQQETTKDSGEVEIGKKGLLSNPFLRDFMNVKILQSTNYIT